MKTSFIIPRRRLLTMLGVAPWALVSVPALARSTGRFGVQTQSIRYDVLTFVRIGAARVYARYP